MNEQSILEIAAGHVEKDGYVVYDDFSEQRPINQTGNKFLFFVRRCALGQSIGEVHSTSSRVLMQTANEDLAPRKVPQSPPHGALGRRAYRF